MLVVLLLAGTAAAQEESSAPAEAALTAAAAAVSPEDASALPGMGAAPREHKEVKTEPPSVISAEWQFLTSRASSVDEDVLEMLLEGLGDWVATNPENSGAAEAQYLKAALRAKLGDQKGALTDLLRYFYEYPGAPSAELAQKLFQETVEKKADKKLKPALLELVAASETGDTPARLSMMLQKVSAQAGQFLYEPLLREYRDFFRRFPGFAGGDMLTLALADLHRAKGEYLAARLTYERLIAVYPASPLLARAKVTLADTLADNLKDYAGALTVYQEVALMFPGTQEAWTAYSRLPALAERKDLFELAVEIYEKIIALYPDREEAYGSFTAEARVLSGPPGRQVQGRTGHRGPLPRRRDSPQRPQGPGRRSPALRPDSGRIPRRSAGAQSALRRRRGLRKGQELRKGPGVLLHGGRQIFRRPPGQESAEAHRRPAG